MATFPEARAAKVERDRRERRYYTPDKLGGLCRFCKTKTDKVLWDLGYHAHPTCGPS